MIASYYYTARFYQIVAIAVPYDLSAQQFYSIWQLYISSKKNFLYYHSVRTNCKNIIRVFSTNVKSHAIDVFCHLDI